MCFGYPRQFKGHKTVITLCNYAIYKICKPWSIPYALWPTAENEVSRSVKEGLLEYVDSATTEIHGHPYCCSSQRWLTLITLLIPTSVLYHGLRTHHKATWWRRIYYTGSKRHLFSFSCNLMTFHIIIWQFLHRLAISGTLEYFWIFSVYQKFQNKVEQFLSGHRSCLVFRWFHCYWMYTWGPL